MNYQFHGVGVTRLPAEPPTTGALHDELESLLHAVWLAERNWTLDDKIALATRHLGGN